MSMFEDMKVKELRTLLSKYRQYHTITGYSRMRKAELLDGLNRRFSIQDGQLIMKTPPQQRTEPTAKTKKRITPVFMGQLPATSTQVFGQQSQKATISNAQRRVLERAHDLEKYYTGSRHGVDEYPNYAF